jgi:hypothetical protein
LLGRKALVCEGLTELGLCIALDNWWAVDQGRDSFSLLGLVLVYGEGASSAARARDLASLGYQVAILGDSDTPLHPGTPELKTRGVEVVLWDGGVAIEARAALDLPWSGVLELLRYVADERGEAPVRQAIGSKTGPATRIPEARFESWPDSPVLRKAIGSAAKSGKWLKSREGGVRLGEITVRHITSIAESDLAAKLAQVREWADRDV